MVFPKKPLVSLEDPDTRDYAQKDPRGFLAQYAAGAILDEIQRVPELLSYLQGVIDKNRRPGLFVLTGSQQLGLLEAVSQSLAGRTALLKLLPFDLGELRGYPGMTHDLFQVLYRGSYPAVHEEHHNPTRWYADYVETYVERDVRQVLRVGDLTTFRSFLRLLAGRSAQLLNLSSTAADLGINHNTVKAWISVLETGYLVHRVPPYFANLGKRLVKNPKLHFIDSGLLCYLLGIRHPQEIRQHPLRGSIFESWVVSEILKRRAHSGLEGGMHFYRDQRGLEIDLVIESGSRLTAVEIKSGQTVSTDSFTALEKGGEVLGQRLGRSVLVYGGNARQVRSKCEVVPWLELDSL